MAAGIRINTESPGAAGETRASEPEDSRLADIEVVDFHIHVHRLRMFSIGPLWLDELVHSLEGDSRLVGGVAERNKVRILQHSDHPQQLRLGG